VFPCARGRKRAAWLADWQPELAEPSGQLGYASSRIAFSPEAGVDCEGAWKAAGAVIWGTSRRKAIFQATNEGPPDLVRCRGERNVGGNRAHLDCSAAALFLGSLGDRPKALHSG